MLKKIINKKVTVFILATFIPAMLIHAQQVWQNRYSLSSVVSVTDKVGLRVNHLRSYEITKNFRNTFYQTGFQLNYELSEKWDITGGTQFLTSASSNKTRTRTFIRAAYTTPVNRHIKWTNAVRIETNSRNENRFRQRIGLYSRISLRKRIDFLKLSPSLGYSLFYNIGGSPVRYYDENGQLIVRQPPNGFHRGRLTINLNSRVNRYLRIGMGYMRQQEFNFLTPDTRKINVYDPVRNRTVRPFRNFNAITISAQINFDPILKK